MNYPNPYAPPPPPKNNTAKIILIVLAVVFGGGIFLVAILAAILFPVFAKAREKARMVSCESNVKQIDLGLMQYIQDHNDKYPGGDYKAAIQPYTMSEQLFHCPSNSVGGESYSFNANLQGVSIAKISSPQSTVVVYEGREQTLDFRHDGKAVVGFADGSVRAIPKDEAPALRWKP